MTVCRPDCGQCCDPVMLPYTRIEAMTDQEIDPGQRKWAERCLTAMSTREAFAKAPWLRGRALRDRFEGFAQPFFFRCSNFDPETKRCTDYDNRPSMCRGYPWYGAPPRPDASLPPDCSFREDLIHLGPTR